MLPIFIFCSCGKDDFHEELEEYNSTFENTIEIIDLESKKFYDTFESEMRDIFRGNPVKTKPWYEKTVVLRNSSDTVYAIIDSLQNVLSSKAPLQTDNLFYKTNEIKKYIISLFDERYSGAIEGFKESLNINEWKKVFSKCENKKTRYSILEKIKTEIKLAEFYALSYLFTKIDASHWRFRKIVAIVIPQSEVVPLGKPYIADIVLGSFDTTLNFEYQLEGKKYLADEYKYTYKEKVTAKEGVVRKPARFVFPHKYTRDSTFIKFEIEYEVVK